MFQVKYVGPGKNFPREVGGAGHVNKNNQTYVIGGGGPLRETHKYNPQNGKWINLPKMRCKRGARPCVFVLGTHIYAAGGYGSGIQKSMETLNLLKMSTGWKWSINLPRSVDRTECATINDRTVVLAGSHPVRYSWVWQLGDRKWTPIPKMIRYRAWFHCSVSDNVRYVYALGGDIPGSMERYDTIKKEWKMMGLMPKKVKEHACVYVAGTIIVTHGISIYMYDVDADTWMISKTKLRRSIKRHSMGLVLL